MVIVEVSVSLPSLVSPTNLFLLMGGIIIFHEKFTHMMDALPGKIRSYIHTILCGIHAPVAKHLLPDINVGHLFCQWHY